MTVQDPTTNYGWDLPTDGGSEDTWGTELNEAIGEALGAAIESVDTVIDALATAIGLAITNKEGLDERVERLESVAPRPAYGRVHLVSTVQLAKASAEDIVWDTEDFDLGGVVDLATQPTRLTIPTSRDGLFTIRGQVTLPYTSASGDDAVSLLLRIVKNGSTEIAVARKHYMNDNTHEDRSGDITISIEALDDAVATDYYELEITYDYNDTGVATKQISQGVMRSFFELYRHWSPLVTIPATVGSVTISNKTSRTSHAVPIGAHVAGDLIVLLFNARANVTITPPAGLDVILDAGAESTVTDGVVVTKVATSSAETATFTTNIGRTSASAAYVIPAETHGVPGRAVEAAVAEQLGSEPAGFIMKPPALTPTWGPVTTLWIVCAAVGDDYTSIAVPQTPNVYADDGEYDGDAGNVQGTQVASRTANVATEDSDGFEHTVNKSGLNWTVAIPGAEIT